MKRKTGLLMLMTGFFTLNIFGQQIADTSFSPVIAKPEYTNEAGPLVLIDEGHNNFHTVNGRYLPFAQMLRADGYKVMGYTGEFKIPLLRNVKILVIANALNSLNIENWYLPTPSAFTPAEILVLTQWVNSGGSLFLIADHMPMGGAAADLASAFGFTFSNGFAADTSKPGPAYFYRKDNTLVSNIITNGRGPDEKVDKIVTFTGQGFRIPEEAEPILRFDKGFLLLESDTAWIFNKNTRYTPIDGWSQGAYMKYGNGRIVFFGEAAMFTAQLAGPTQTRVGMNSDYAGENYKLLLNIIHWLDRKI